VSGYDLVGYLTILAMIAVLLHVLLNLLVASKRRKMSEFKVIWYVASGLLIVIVLYILLNLHA